MKERDYGSYIDDIIEHMNYAEEFIKCMTFEEFANDKKTVLSVTKCIEIVGEARSISLIRLEKNIQRFLGEKWRESGIGSSMVTSR